MVCRLLCVVFVSNIAPSHSAPLRSLPPYYLAVSRHILHSLRFIKMVEQEEPNNETLAGTKRPVDDGDEISLKIGYKRDSMTVSLKLDSTVAELKKLIESHTKIPPDNQKLLYKGQLKDEQRLRDVRD